MSSTCLGAAFSMAARPAGSRDHGAAGVVGVGLAADQPVLLHAPHLVGDTALLPAQCVAQVAGGNAVPPGEPDAVDNRQGAAASSGVSHPFWHCIFKRQRVTPPHRTNIASPVVPQSRGRAVAFAVPGDVGLSRVNNPGMSRTTAVLASGESGRCLREIAMSARRVEGWIIEWSLVAQIDDRGQAARHAERPIVTVATSFHLI